MPSKSRKPGRRSRGEGGLYQRKSDGLWVGTVDIGYDAAGNRLRSTVTSKSYTAAFEKLAALKKSVAERGAPDSKVTVENWLSYWITDIVPPRNRPRTAQAYRSIVERHLIPHLGRKRLDQLAPQHVRQMLRALERADLAPSMVLKVYVVLKKSLTDAVNEERVGRNVAALVDRPGLGEADDRGAYTIEQAGALFRAMLADVDASRWVTAVVLGPRPAEVHGLKIDRVDLDQALVATDRQLQRIPYRHGCGEKTGDAWPCGRKFAGDCDHRELAVPPGFVCEQLDGALCLTLPKSKAGKRVTALSPLLVDLYREQIARQSTRPNPHGLMWTRADGRPLDAKEDRAAWAKLVESAGLPPLDLYAARHTFVSLSLDGGEDVKAVGQVAGHSNPKVTRGYHHVAPSASRGVVERLTDRLLEAAKPAAAVGPGTRSETSASDPS